MNLLQAIGGTPLVELMNVDAKPGVHVLCKLEGCNPGGSVKDRPGAQHDRQGRGARRPHAGQDILEPTSGNTGIAIAMIGAAKGYQVRCACRSARAPSGCRSCRGSAPSCRSPRPGRASTAPSTRPTAWSSASPSGTTCPTSTRTRTTSSRTWRRTGPEIWEQTAGEVDYFVAGMGTTGTLMGTGRYLKSVKPAVRIVGVEPVMGHAIQGLKNMTESMVPGIFAAGELDDRRLVDDDEAFDATRMLARGEGLFVGSSSGAAVAVALQDRRGDRRGHHRRAAARPRRPLPQHDAVPLHLRQVPGVTRGSGRARPPLTLVARAAAGARRHRR